MAEKFRTFSDFASFEYSCTVEGTVYRFRFQFHPRCGGWYVDIMESDRTPIVMGTRVVLGWPLFEGHKDPMLPSGLTLALNMDGDLVELTEQDELGDRVRVVYVPLDELTAPETTPSPVVEPV